VILSIAAVPDATAQARGHAALSAASTPLGRIVVDSRGRTVYEFTADSKGHSACAAACLAYWPIVAAPATMPSSLPGISGRLASITRANGARQLTLGGMPMYTFSGDAKPGQVNGQGSTGSGAKWWVVSPSGRRY
jgi:predicted lipoprotein with Yx(FWY)xxD motif